jgi:hypothetical protein
LPAIKGRWIDRFPLYLLNDTPSSWPLAAFCYVDPQVFSERRFRSFLERHVRLWERLGAFQVTYVTDHRWNSRAAERVFERFTEAHWPRSVRDPPSIRERILKAFRLDKCLRLADRRSRGGRERPRNSGRYAAQIANAADARRGSLPPSPGPCKLIASLETQQSQRNLQMCGKYFGVIG